MTREYHSITIHMMSTTVFVRKKREWQLKIYHGSQQIIRKPEFGKGRAYNDYGQGIYCTESVELAKEWACPSVHDGYANCYELCLDELNILYLTRGKFKEPLINHRYFITIDKSVRESSLSRAFSGFGFPVIRS